MLCTRMNRKSIKKSGRPEITIISAVPMNSLASGAKASSNLVSEAVSVAKDNPQLLSNMAQATQIVAGKVLTAGMPSKDSLKNLSTSAAVVLGQPDISSTVVSISATAALKDNADIIPKSFKTGKSAVALLGKQGVGVKPEVQSVPSFEASVYQVNPVPSYISLHDSPPIRKLINTDVNQVLCIGLDIPPPPQSEPPPKPILSVTRSNTLPLNYQRAPVIEKGTGSCDINLEHVGHTENVEAKPGPLRPAPPPPLKSQGSPATKHSSNESNDAVPVLPSLQPVRPAPLAPMRTTSMKHRDSEHKGPGIARSSTMPIKPFPTASPPSREKHEKPPSPEVVEKCGPTVIKANNSALLKSSAAVSSRTVTSLNENFSRNEYNSRIDAESSSPLCEDSVSQKADDRKPPPVKPKRFFTESNSSVDHKPYSLESMDHKNSDGSLKHHSGPKKPPPPVKPKLLKRGGLSSGDSKPVGAVLSATSVDSADLNAPSVSSVGESDMSHLDQDSSKPVGDEAVKRKSAPMIIIAKKNTKPIATFIDQGDGLHTSDTDSLVDSEVALMTTTTEVLLRKSLKDVSDFPDQDLHTVEKVEGDASNLIPTAAIQDNDTREFASCQDVFDDKSNSDSYVRSAATADSGVQSHEKSCVTDETPPCMVSSSRNPSTLSDLIVDSTEAYVSHSKQKKPSRPVSCPSVDKPKLRKIKSQTRRTQNSPPSSPPPPPMSPPMDPCAITDVASLEQRKPARPTALPIDNDNHLSAATTISARTPVESYLLTSACAPAVSISEGSSLSPDTDLKSLATGLTSLDAKKIVKPFPPANLQSKPDPAGVVVEDTQKPVRPKPPLNLRSRHDLVKQANISAVHDSGGESTHARPARPAAPVLAHKDDEELASERRPKGGLMDTIMASMDLGDPHAVVLYDFDSVNSEDLAVHAGDVVLLKNRPNDDWFVCSFNGKEGLVPSAFMEVIVDLPSEARAQVEEQLGIEATFEKKGEAPLKISTSDSPEMVELITTPHAIALHPFVAMNSNELSFDAGDAIILRKKVSDDWFEGACKGCHGEFPASFVAVVLPLPDDFVAVQKSDLLTAKEQLSPASKPKTADGHSAVSGPRCRALFDYESALEEDLRFKAGDVIRLREHVNEEWLRGCLAAREGMFPKSFVEIIEDLPKLAIRKDSGVQCGSAPALSSPQPILRARFDFEARNHTELSLRTGDVIANCERVNEEWYRGELVGKKGLFPIIYAEPLPAGVSSSSRASKASSKAKGQQEKRLSEDISPKAIALYDFEPMDDTELRFKEGDVIYLLRELPEDWLEGELSGACGKFPSSFVEVVTPLIHAS